MNLESVVTLLTHSNWSYSDDGHVVTLERNVEDEEQTMKFHPVGTTALGDTNYAIEVTSKATWLSYLSLMVVPEEKITDAILYSNQYLSETEGEVTSSTLSQLLARSGYCLATFLDVADETITQGVMFQKDHGGYQSAFQIIFDNKAPCIHMYLSKKNESKDLVFFTSQFIDVDENPHSVVATTVEEGIAQIDHYLEHFAPKSTNYVNLNDSNPR